MQKRNTLVNYLRTRRKKAGLTQRELGMIVGYTSKDSIYRHEGFRSVPPLLMAFAYEIVFQEPVSDLFPGIRDTVEAAVDDSLAKFEHALEEQLKSSRGTKRAAIEYKLKWLRKRRLSLN